MTLDGATAARVAARIREACGGLETLTALIADTLARHPAAPSPEVAVVQGVGAMVHDFYTGLERVFGWIAPGVNGTLPEGPRWHRELLHLMTLEIPRRRPPVLDAATEAQLVEYLKFRHVFRNLYGYRLRWQRVRELAEGVAPAWACVRRELEGFLGFLDALAEGDDR